VSNVGQAVLTIGGTIVGAYFGNPQLGYMLGSLVGQALFPTQLPTVRGPRLEDAKLQTSTLGAPIPWVWGTFILAGQVIWRSPFVERKVKEKAGGKGGPEQTSIHYEYRVNVAIGLCGRPPTRDAAIVGIRRIWADTKLIFDAGRPVGLEMEWDPDAPTNAALPSVMADAMAKFAASAAAAAKIDIYYGDEIQEPDPTIETWEGVGNVPAYRGLAYLVIRDFELADYGNRIPSFRVEVMTAGTVGDLELGLYSNDTLYRWEDGFTKDPRNQLNGHEYSGDAASNFTGGWTASLDTALADREATEGRPLLKELLWRWSKSSTPTTVSWCDGEDAQDRLHLWLWYNSLDIPGDSCESWSCSRILTEKGAGVVFHARRDFLVVTEPGVPESYYFGGYSEPGTIDCGGGHYKQELSDVPIRVRRTHTPPDGCQGYLPVPGTTDFCVTIDGYLVPAVTWTLTPGMWHVLRPYDDDGNFVTSYPLNPARPAGHPEYNSQEFWETAYAAAVAEGKIAPGLVYGVDYPQSQSYGYVGSIGGTLADPDPIPLSDIVADICEACGLTSYDVADLEEVMVHGYALTSPMTGKEGIDPLRPYGYFDAVESELTYKFVRRGKPSAMTIDTADLAARLSTEERPPAITVMRAQDAELPRYVRGHFIDIDRDGDPGQAEQQRQTVDSVNMADLHVPVVMPASRGQAMVDTVLFERWIGRNTYQCALPFKYIALEPSDCIDVMVDGTLERMRITRQEIRALSVIELSAVRDDATIYAGTDIMGDNAGGGSSIPIGGVPSPTELILLELPALRAQDTDCGYYAAARGLLPGWPGAVVYRATSVAGTFRQVAWTSIAATMGVIEDNVGADTLADSGETLTGTSEVTEGIDHSTVLRVQLFSGSFESVSTEDLIAGENLIAVGQEGDWELIRFQLAVQGSDGIWELSSLLREQLGTARRTILAGDEVVLMTGPGIMRIDESATAEGVQRVLRAVTSGTSLEDAEDHYITTRCLSRATSDTAAAVTEFNAVLSRALSAAPAAPSCGDTYIVGPVAPPDGDAWAGRSNDFARWNCDTLSWQFAEPVTGRLVLVDDESAHVYWDGAQYIDLSVGGGGGTGDQELHYKSADQSITSSTALTDDTVLQASLVAGHSYIIEIHVRHQINATPDWKCDLNYTGAAANFVASYHRWNTAGETAGVFRQDVSLNTVMIWTVGSLVDGVANFVVAIEAATSGTFSFRFAQNTSNLAAATVRRGSWMRVTKVA